MKRSLIALGLALFAVVGFAEGQHRNALESAQDSIVKQQLADSEEWLRSRPATRDAVQPEQDSVAEQQLADSEEWLRSRPGGNQDQTRDSTSQQT